MTDERDEHIHDRDDEDGVQALPTWDARLRAAYDAGWLNCTRWVKRDDLPADMDSPAYLRERDETLGTAGVAPSPVPENPTPIPRQKFNTSGVAAVAHSKSEYKRRVAQGDTNVQPPTRGVGVADGRADAAGVTHGPRLLGPRIIDWGEVDEELLQIMADFCDTDHKAFADLRTLLRKVSGQ